MESDGHPAVADEQAQVMHKLALANGAGAGAQTAIGTAVLGGMVTSTVLVIFFAPLFYVMIYKAISQKRSGKTGLNNELEGSAHE